MLNNILKTIDDKAKQEIDTILKEKERMFLALEKEHQENIQSRHEEKKAELVSKTRVEIEEFRQIEQQKFSFRLQEVRNKIVKDVYGSAEKAINELSDSEFKTVLKHLLNYLPEGIEGEISAGGRTAKVLQSMFSLKCLVKSDLDEEGIVFRSKDMEVDLRISQVLKHNREATDPEVIKVLFAS
ncbi:MAG: hypothetical protein HQ539_03840 [Parcubacteria group bacterium]|nr:hypothetical protein [Parcubacteria group bacterium]